MKTFANYITPGFQMAPIQPVCNQDNAKRALDTSFDITSTPDEYYYHATLANVAQVIVRSQTLKKGKAIASRNIRANATGRVFLTDRNGVNFWIGKVYWGAVDTGQYNQKDPDVKLVRVAKTSVQNAVPDQKGTIDAGAPAWYVEGEISL